MALMINKQEFLEDLKSKESEILYLSISHIFSKIYEEQEHLEEDSLKEFLSNYKNFHLYLNDFAGVIYNRYGSHINTLYIQMCNYLEIDVDNKYTLEHYITKLEKQTPELLLGLTLDDIQKQTIIHFDEKLEQIQASPYYISNLEEFELRVKKLQSNISLVKKALGM